MRDVVSCAYTGFQHVAVLNHECVNFCLQLIDGIQSNIIHPHME